MTVLDVCPAVIDKSHRSFWYVSLVDVHIEHLGEDSNTTQTEAKQTSVGVPADFEPSSKNRGSNLRRQRKLKNDGDGARSKF